LVDGSIRFAASGTNFAQTAIFIAARTITTCATRAEQAMQRVP
jgi:hypothetical protein